MKQIFGVYNITGNGVATSKSINEMLSKKQQHIMNFIKFIVIQDIE